ncbi:MAG: 2'-5' RNA ligase family protein, partial [Nitriliruptoraceae bacterium]
MTARVFVGVQLAAPVEQPLDAAIAPLRDIHTDVVWTRPQGWHVTLAFCGDVDAASERRIGDVVADVASVTCAPVLIPRGIAVWHRRTLVLELADEPAGALATVGAHLQRRLAAAGVPVAQRDVAGHVTLARQRRDPLAVRAAANAAQTAV